jgi:hypothetical protein
MLYKGPGEDGSSGIKVGRYRMQQRHKKTRPEVTATFRKREHPTGFLEDSHDGDCETKSRTFTENNCQDILEGSAPVKGKKRMRTDQEPEMEEHRPF